jgi:peptide/nickel transport system substrate-binding protein
MRVPEPDSVPSDHSGRRFLDLAMGRRGLAGLGAAAALGLGRRASAQDANTLIAAYPSNMGQSRHPLQQFGGSVDYTICNMFFDNLLMRDANYKVAPALAESYEVRSLERVRLRIRDGVRFHNGKQMTVEDVKYSLEQTLSPDTTFMSSYFKRWLDRVEIIDRNTVETVAKVPYRVVPELLAYYSFIFPEGTEMRGYTNPIGTGPFRFSEYVANNRVVGLRNDNYWGAKPRFQRLVLRQIPEHATRMAALVSGEIDFAENIAVEDVPVVKNGGADVASIVSNRLLFLAFNRTGDTPFKDRRVRQAIHHSIDKEGIRQALYSGLGAPAEGPYASRVAYFKSDLRRYDFNPDKARALLREAGYERGFETTLSVPNNRYPKDTDIAQVIAAQLSEFGIKVNIRVADFITWQQELRDDRDAKTGRYGMHIAGWATQYGDPDAAFGPFEATSRWNFGGFNSPRMTELMAQGNTTQDPEQLARIYGEIQEILWDTEAQCAGICFLPYLAGISKKLGRLTLTADEIQHWGDVV